MNPFVRIGDIVFSRRRPLDGALGTELQARFGVRGATVVRSPVESPEAVASIHQSYVEAGAQALTTGTLIAASEADAVALVTAAVTGARQIASLPVFVSFAPLNLDGLPYAARAAANAGASLILIETATRLAELCTAVSAVRAACPGVPVVASLVPDSRGDTVLACGSAPEECALRLRESGADAIGANCAPPPAVFRFLGAMSSALPPDFPRLARPSAGIPTGNGVSLSYPWESVPWAESSCAAISALPALLIGGCCGAGPRHIAALATVLARE